MPKMNTLGRKMNEFALGAKSTDGRTDGTDYNISDFFLKKCAYNNKKRSEDDKNINNDYKYQNVAKWLIYCS